MTASNELAVLLRNAEDALRFHKRNCVTCYTWRCAEAAGVRPEFVNAIRCEEALVIQDRINELQQRWQAEVRKERQQVGPA